MTRNTISKHAKADTAPGIVRLALEMRAPWELGIALAAYPFMRGIPSGDGHPVLVFPGLAAGDITTVVIRRFLRDLGYAAHAWEQGLNLGPVPACSKPASNASASCAPSMAARSAWWAGAWAACMRANWPR